jgi:hypothetical protein
MYLPDADHRRLDGVSGSGSGPITWSSSFYDGWDLGFLTGSSTYGAPYRRLAGGGTGMAGSPYYCQCERFDFETNKYVPVISGGPAPPDSAWSGEWTDRTMGNGYAPFGAYMWQVTSDTIEDTVARCESGNMTYTRPGTDAPLPCEYYFTDLGLGKDNCMADGVRNGRTVSFTTAVYCEMLRAYTVKSDLPAYATFFRNNWMHLACTISAVMTIAVSVIPFVNDTIFQLNMISPQLYSMALAFAFGCAVIDEIYKIRYRGILQERKKDEYNSMAAQAVNDKIEVVVDLLEKHAKMQLDNSIDMRELKVHVGEIEKSIRDPGASLSSPSGAGLKSQKSTHNL